MVLEWLKLGGLVRQAMLKHKNGRNPESGITVIEVLVATVILLVCSLSILGLVATSIAMNNRNKMDSTGTMLAQSIVEQIKATIIGSEDSSLTDCLGTVWPIDTAPGGATLNGSKIDFTETSPPDGYHMVYVVKSPCTTSGTQEMTYDVRWNVSIVGAPLSPTNTFLLTVGARTLGHGEGNTFYALPINFRVMVGN